MYLAKNFERTLALIRESAIHAGRPSDSVRLIAVSKTVDSEVIRKAHALGQLDFAENRPQVLRDKVRELSDLAVKWHFIGPLQTNKIKYVYPLADLVHSVDRCELIEAFIDWQKKTGRKCPCLLQVHISGEETKQGFACDEILSIIAAYNNNPHLDIRGMMGMAAFDSDETVVRCSFRKLKQLFEMSKKLEGSSYKAVELSMGMSGDFVPAIEEGATIVRIGTALFSQEP